MPQSSFLVLLFVTVFFTSKVQSQCLTAVAPAGCSGCHDVITCDMSVQTLPISLATFPFDIANDFTLNNIAGTLTVAASAFSSFTSYNTTAVVDYNIIRFSCNAGASLQLVAGSFAGLEHYRNLQIIDCNLNLVDDLFADFVNLTSLAIYGGSITSVSSNVFRGLDMVWTGAVGSASINITADLPGASVPVDFFGPVAPTLVELRITDNNWKNYHKDLLWNMSSLRLLDMSRTPNDYVPDPFFDNTPTMSFVYLYGLNWTCVCPSNTWLFDWEVRTGVRIHSDFICQTPEAEKGRYMRKWKIDSCDDLGIGFYVGTYWVGLYQIMLWVLTIVFLILAIVALVLARRALKTKPVGGTVLKPGAEKKKEAREKAKAAPQPQPKAGPPEGGQPPPTYESGDEGAAKATVVTAAVHKAPETEQPRPSSKEARPSSGKEARPASANKPATPEAAQPPPASQAFQEPEAPKPSGIDRFRKMAAKVRLQKKVVTTWGDD